MTGCTPDDSAPARPTDYIQFLPEHPVYTAEVAPATSAVYSVIWFIESPSYTPAKDRCQPDEACHFQVSKILTTTYTMDKIRCVTFNQRSFGGFFSAMPTSFLLLFTRLTCGVLCLLSSRTFMAVIFTDFDSINHGSKLTQPSP